MNALRYRVAVGPKVHPVDRYGDVPRHWDDWLLK